MESDTKHNKCIIFILFKIDYISKYQSTTPSPSGILNHYYKCLPNYLSVGKVQ